jgi:regulator of nucleoside diphosphate kinase
VTTIKLHEFERPPIVLTETDRACLAALADAATRDNPDVARFLHEELARADIVPEGAPGSVTMGSEVKFTDHRLPRIRRCKLAYPGETNDSHSISVLTPIGSALLGLGPGQSINWIDAGIEQRLTVLEVSSSLSKISADGSIRPLAEHAGY